MGEHIGFIGVGRMGGAMAGRLLDAGHSLTVFDVSEAALAPVLARGATRAASPKAVGDAAALVLASVPTPDILRTTALGPDGVIGGGAVKTFIDLSTTGPKVAAEVAKALAAKGMLGLDAPVSGGVKGAVDGTLAVMVAGCDEATFEALRPVLSVIGKLFHMGETAGAGQTMKLANNLIAASAIAITAEGMAFGIKAGLDPKLMIEILNVSSGMNTATRDKWPRAVLPRTFDFGFATALSFKDVRLCLEEAEAMGVPMVVGSAVRQILSITNQTYGPDSDFTSIARVVEDWAGIEPKPVK